MEKVSMRKAAYTVICTSLLITAPAWAQQTDTTTNTTNQTADNSQAGTTTQTDNTSTTTTTETGPAQGLSGEVVGIKPQVGFINFRDAANNFDNRGTVGLMFDVNGASAVGHMMGMSSGSPLFFGPSVGAFYSHIGGIDSGFLGNSTTASTDPNAGAGSAGANLLIFPADLKVGWNFGYFRTSIHAGGNVFYSSVANAVLLGSSPPNTTTGSNWMILPDVGVDLEYGVTNGLALIARPDWTLAGSNRMLGVSIGASIPIG
jgi:hypothetical protein